jgi:hypothetical protein
MYKNNSYCSHLMEHCVFSSYPNIDNFFDIDIESNWTSWLWYTKYYLPDYKNIQTFIHHITKPLDTRIISKERRIIREETEDEQNTTWNILINKLWKLLYWKTFSWYPQWAKLTHQEIQDYHKLYYQPDNIWILDDNFTIISRPEREIYPIQKKSLQKPSQIHLQAEWKKFQAFLLPYNSVYEYTLFYFLDWFYTESSNYIYRYLGDSYYPPICHFFEFPDKLAFIRRDNYSLDISKEFFIKAKIYFIKNQVNLQEIIAVNEILKLEKTTQYEIIDCIESFDYLFIKEFL